MTFFGTATQPEPGDLFVASAGGGLGVAIKAGEILDGDPVRALAWALSGRPSPAPGVEEPWAYEHAGIYIGNHTIVQAQPGGADAVAVRDWQLGRKYVLWSTGVFDLTTAQRNLITGAASRAAETHIPYSIADYLALTAHKLGLGTKALQDYIADSGHMICSQLDDWCYQQGSVQIFNDGRWNGFVTPADLAGEFIRRAQALKLI